MFNIVSVFLFGALPTNPVVLYPDYTPDTLHAIALTDLETQVPAERYHKTRYVSLNQWDDEDRPAAIKALTAAFKLTSWRTKSGNPVVINDVLLRIDLAEYAWDVGSRSIRLKELERRGVDFKLNAEDRKLFLDPWEQFSKDEPFWFTSQVYNGRSYKGWVNPASEYVARNLAFTRKLVVSGKWLLPRLLTEKNFDGVKGYYSLLLMFPPKERDLYKVLLIDIETVNRDNQLRRGGSTLYSIVALHNRELQLIRSMVGLHDAWVWLTFDVNVDAVGNKSVQEAFAGTVQHDGREIIGTLPSGLLWFYLANGQGDQAAFVPENIAQIKQPLLPVRETRVVNAYKCFECHIYGVNHFDDVISKSILNPKVELKVFVKDKNALRVATEIQKLEDYYLSPLGQTISMQINNYTQTLFAQTGMVGLEASTNIVTLIEDYIHDPVTPEIAAREIGLPLDKAEQQWRISGNSFLNILQSGGSIRRVAWEQSLKHGLKAVQYPWESIQKPK